MAAYALHRTNQEEVTDPNETRDTMFLLGGLALVLFGTGLIVTNPTVRKLLGNMKIGSLLSGVVPDLERYMKLRSM